MKQSNSKQQANRPVNPQLNDAASTEPLVYCWRSENCVDDNAVLRRLPKGEMLRFQSVRESSLPDTVNELTVKTLTLEQLRNIMRKVEDGHVMWQTVQPKHLYTGERDHDLY